MALAVAAVSACDDGTTAPRPKTNLSVDFCAGDIPAWFAVQNEGEGWQQVSGNSSGTFTFEAASKVSIAFVTVNGSSYSTDVLNLTRDELQDISGKACQEVSGSKSVGGTVAGITGQQVVRLSMAHAVAGATASNTSYNFTGLPDGPLDLVATRRATSSTEPPDRIIVRRNLNLQSGATIPVVDFATTEAQPLSTATVTVANRGSDFVDLGTQFLSATGTEHQLMQLTSSDASAFTFVSVPTALRGPNDLHLLTAIASAASGTREVSQYYGSPSDRTLTFGPTLSAPSMSIASMTPYVRPRLTVVSQAEYGTAMEAFFSQLSGASFRTVRIFTSAAFLGGRPSSWTLDMPDLSAAGYQNTWAFPNTALLNANARGFDASTTAILGGAPADGLTIKSAIRGTTTIVALARSSVSPRLSSSWRIGR